MEKVVVVDLAVQLYSLPAARKERDCSHFHLLSAAQNVKILWHGTLKTCFSHLEILVAKRSPRDPDNYLFNQSKQLWWGSTSLPSSRGPEEARVTLRPILALA